LVLFFMALLESIIQENLTGFGNLLGFYYEIFGLKYRFLIRQLDF
jgi:hypothetical protein